jgi:hypothetical protein
LKFAVFVAGMILAAGSGVFELSGSWIFQAKASDGLISGRLQLREDGRNLFVTFWIDNHVLQGKTETDGKEFAVVLTHSDGSGEGHRQRIRLTGKLDGNTLSGSFDNGTDRGAWVGMRE